MKALLPLCVLWDRGEQHIMLGAVVTLHSEQNSQCDTQTQSHAREGEKG